MAASPRPAADRATRTAHDRFLESGAVDGHVRDLVADSWVRSTEAGIDPGEAAAPTVREADEVSDYRTAHPLSQVFPLLYDVLGRAAEECDSLMAVGDADGQLLWVCGSASVLARAERINFTEGSAWDEGHAGTNAPGTALRLDAAVQIRAAEHFRHAVQAWSCAAAPIHDPTTQAILGIVDLTGGDDVATPQTMATIRAAARMAEAELGRLQAVAGSARLWVPPALVSAEGLGRPDCQVTIGSRTVRLSPRHSEILVLLVEHEQGASGDQLAVELYEEDVSASTMRAELARLRTLLGADVLDSRPYRLRHEITCDWTTVASLLRAGKPAEAVAAYHGPLLPQSDAPGVVEVRRRLEHQVRRRAHVACA